MKQRPIIFNTEMVRAILDGRKTQTRRPIKGNPRLDNCGNFIVGDSNYGQDINGNPQTKAFIEFNSPFGNVGDQLWVRETFCIGKYEAEDKSPEYGGEELYISQCFGDKDVIYKQHAVDIGCNLLEASWKPSIHMPRWASRILLEVTSVRIERLNDISKEDAKAEGCDSPSVPSMGWKLGARHNFMYLWNSIYNNWNDNPWVWVIEFKVVSTGEVAA